MCEGGHGTAGQTSPMTTDQPDINDGYVTANRTGRAAIAASVYYYVAGGEEGEAEAEASWKRIHSHPDLCRGYQHFSLSTSLCCAVLVGWTGSGRAGLVLYQAVHAAHGMPRSMCCAWEHAGVGICRANARFLLSGLCSHLVCIACDHRPATGRQASCTSLPTTRQCQRPRVTAPRSMACVPTRRRTGGPPVRGQCVFACSWAETRRALHCPPYSSGPAVAGWGR